jgi:hypothetical protein
MGDLRLSRERCAVACLVPDVLTPGLRPRFGLREPAKISVKCFGHRSFCAVRELLLMEIVSAPTAPQTSHTSTVRSATSSSYPLSPLGNLHELRGLPHAPTPTGGQPTRSGPCELTGSRGTITVPESYGRFGEEEDLWMRRL